MYGVESDQNMKKDSRLVPILVIVICVVAMMAFVIKRDRQNKNQEEYRTTGFSMGTVVSITIYDENAEQIAGRILSDLDVLDTSVLSWRSEDSEVWKLNHSYIPGQEYPVSRELAEYLMIAESVADESDGLLDITIRPLAEVWGIEDGKTEIPDEADMYQALELVDHNAIHVAGLSNTESVPDIREYAVIVDREGISIDFGAIGKGIACDHIAEELEKEQSSGCVAVGGSIVVHGAKPDGSNWVIGIRNPRGDEESVMGILSIDTSDGSSRFISTSGDYEKYFMKDGIRYHHILNPQTGYPANTGTISATVICDSGVLSDALSTVCILTDREKAFEILETFGAEGILIDENLQVYMTKGIQDSFSIRDEAYHVVTMD